MKKQGLYDPRFEKDSCGIGLIAHIRGTQSHSIVQDGLTILRNLSHRAAQGADPETGDGAGLLVQIPHEFLKAEMQRTSVELPEPGQYAVGMFFLPTNPGAADEIVALVEKVAAMENFPILAWRDVPVRPELIGTEARRTAPLVRQVFFDRAQHGEEDFERMLYVLRRGIENSVLEHGVPGREDFHISSLSSRTLVYKGLLLPKQIDLFYPDLQDARFKSALAMVHSRFSTNTFPSWPLAHPFRYLCHNGEINTIQGNLNWMRARQSRLKSDIFGKNLKKVFPIVREGQSDSASLDNALEFLVQGGRSLAHAMMMLIPEPFASNPLIDSERRAFYEFHSAMMEPWDGPAAVCFTDGKMIGATLDRNGLRPCRYQITSDDLLILSSEAGALPIAPERISFKGRLEPGRMLLLDLVQGRIVDDEEIKREISRREPYSEWISRNRVATAELPEPQQSAPPEKEPLHRRQQIFGYTREELKVVLLPMLTTAEEATSSMGNDTPLAVLSDRPQLLFKYFRQLFAQVTNPPTDSIREQLVMSLVTNIGPKPNLLAQSPEGWRQIKVQQPILTNTDLAKIREMKDPNFKSTTLKMLFRAKEGSKGFRAALLELCRQASKAVLDGNKFIILSDRGVNQEWAPIPSLLAVSAIHHHLVRKSQRSQCGLILETAEPRDVHHFACLLGYGAGSINPYLVFETIDDLKKSGALPDELTHDAASSNYIKAIDKGLLKIFSKMGISTIQSYCGAQIFEAIGIQSVVAEKFFTGTPSRIEGIGLNEIAEESLARHRESFKVNEFALLPEGGEVHYRVQGEHHNWDPEAISKLQHATRSNDWKSFQDFSAHVNEEGSRHFTLRGLLDFNFATQPIPLGEVESAADIVKRFTTGAMSLGALGKEAHETLAVAMNRIGAKSNSGEGGEDPDRFIPAANGDSRNSAIKQVASARFGVTTHYLMNARELQIKMAQGAKPGEGGQLPGPKVDENIAKLRHSTPGVTLISPPPHHDIYSIEDLAQLIFDLKNVNPEADISVKLVSEVGIGTVAAGVAKAHAEKILVSGDSGGTGASPLSSIKYAGGPWELGLAETHQTLVLNGLRGRVRLETDGQLKTGRDVVVAALLGAEEFGFSTAPLIVEGCIMMRKCHLNTCPVGIATQDPELRKKFAGKPEHVINYFFFVAEEVRELLSRLGVRRLVDLVGRTEKLKADKAMNHWKAKGLDLGPLLLKPDVEAGRATHWSEKQNHSIDQVLDRKLIELCGPAIERKQRVCLDLPIHNTDRTTGAMLSGVITKKYGPQGLPQDTISIQFKGSAGQSFGAFLVPGVTLTLEGESNDYVGKGLSGGRITIRPPREARFVPEESILIGNTSLYGATGGEAYFRGRAGERFAVRNSGAKAVVEGTGDHGCEYMTGGTVVVLGRTGRNFAAGMSGGVAFVWDEDGAFESRCNLSMVELEAVSDPSDRQLLRELLENHVLFTESGRARMILERWESAVLRFKKVIPTEYKKVLAERRKRLSARIPEGEMVRE